MVASPMSIHGSRRGAALVELAIVLVVLMLLVMGIMEFGLMFRNYLDVAQSVSAGCRSAALGSNTSVVNERITSTMSSFGLNNEYSSSPVLQYRTYTKATGVWTGWQTLGNGTSGYNNAPSSATLDSQIKIAMVYTYPLATGAFLSPIIGSGGNVSLSGTCVMRREQTP